MNQDQKKLLKEMKSKAFFVAETETNPLLRRAKLVSIRKPFEEISVTNKNYVVAKEFVEYLKELEECQAPTII